MKRAILLSMVFCLLLMGCSNSQTEVMESTAPAESTVPASAATPEPVVTEPPVTEPVAAEPAENAQTIMPLPDTTMENLTDTILSVSLEEGNAYVDDSGIMQMDLTVYSYDTYDMVDIANLKVGDTIVRHSGQVSVTSKQQHEAGMICINGGLENGGFDLVTDDTGIFYELGFDDAKNWYALGEVTIRVSADFEGTDNADPEQGECILYPGSFLNGEVTNYDFTPHNTTVRVEAGQIVALSRSYTP